MVEFMKLHVSIILKHILDRGPRLAGDNSDDSDDDEAEGAENDKEWTGGGGGSRRRLVASKKRPPTNDQLLDLDGPKLIIGVKNWLVYYQIIGQINIMGKPLYVSIIFKTLVLALAMCVVYKRFILKFIDLQVIDDSFKNPIFLFISALATLTFATQVIVIFYTNLFNLCPMFKVLTTPRLCFISAETLHLLGTRSLSFILSVLAYNTFIICLLVQRSWTEFVNEFQFPTFLLEIFAVTVIFYQIFGLTLMDLYIRSSFGCWLLALKSHLERQFTYLHRYQRRSVRLGAGGGCGELVSSSSPGANVPASPRGASPNNNNNLKPPIWLITLDEIQKNLNHMDDHLEVLRSTQISTLVLISLNAFLGNGSLFLLAYHLMADQSNYYHGLLVLILSINYIVIIFVSYLGDRWVFYALGSFVQTVEDEYFMQSDIKTLDNSKSNNNNNRPQRDSDSADIERLDEPISPDLEANHSIQQILLIKKKDVLFCREFLHQFENHLATPWSKLTFKSHLHLLRTFVTLVAAQIIFDHEH